MRGQLLCTSKLWWERRRYTESSWKSNLGSSKFWLDTFTNDPTDPWWREAEVSLFIKVRLEAWQFSAVLLSCFIADIHYTMCTIAHQRTIATDSRTYSCNEEGCWSRSHSHCMWTSWHHLIHSLNYTSTKQPIRHREKKVGSPILRTVYCHQLDWRAEGSSPLAK